MKHKKQRKHSDKRGKQPQKSAPSVTIFAETLKHRGGVLEIDLHGYTVSEAIETLERTIDKAILSNIKQFNIIHGFGTGKIKNAVHKYLHNFKHIRSFHISINNPGVTVVYL